MKRSSAHLYLLASLFFLAILSFTSISPMDTGPINVHSQNVRESTHYLNEFGDDGALVIGVSFSGGGTRAAAFAYGVLRELNDVVIDEEPRIRSATDSIHMVSGTSGGAVIAAYFGIHGSDDFHDFREKFLEANVERNMRTSISWPENLRRAWRGGANDRRSLADWLDMNLFDGATFSAFDYDYAPSVWLTASDIYNGVPFIFTDDTFAALCSDLRKTRIADAVAASAAFPVVFAPLDVSTDNTKCDYEHPEWLLKALDDPLTPVRLNAYARALATYHQATELTTVRLLDGGLTDNLGITGFALERASADTEYGPLTKEQAVRLKRLLFIVTDSGREAQAQWGSRLHSPRLYELVPAVAETAITSSVRKGFDALTMAALRWQNDLVRFRCSISDEAVISIRGNLVDWDCQDLSVNVEILSFRSFGAEKQSALNKIPTRLSLPVSQIDFVIEAGRSAVRQNQAIQEVLIKTREQARVSRSP